MLLDVLACSQYCFGHCAPLRVVSMKPAAAAHLLCFGSSEKAAKARLLTGQRNPQDMMYEIQEVAGGVIESDFINDVHSVMSDNNLFDSIPSASRTQLLESKQTRQLARAAARMHAIHNRTRNYPFKTFRSLNDKDLLPEIQRDADCPERLDVWSAAVSVVKVMEPLCLVPCRDHCTVSATLQFQYGHGRLARKYYEQPVG